MAFKPQARVVAVSRDAQMKRFFWRSSLVVAASLALMLLASGLARAQSGNWIRPAPPLVGYVGSSATPQLCQHTYPLSEGCWLGLDAQLAIDKVCALHGDVRGPASMVPTGDKHFTAEVQCAKAKVGIAGQPFYCDSSGRIEAKYRDPSTGKGVFSCTPPPMVADAAKSMGCAGCTGPAAVEGVNAAVGNAYRYETDYRNSANPLLEIRRVYNSMDARPRAFGFNWTGSYERRLEIYKGLRVVAFRPDANSYYFDEARGKFNAEAGVKDTLVKVQGGKGDFAWRYTTADRSVEEYDARGVLVAIIPAKGDAVRMEYNAAGQLARVADAAGRSVAFTYDRDGRISRAVDADGKAYDYAYGGASGCRSPVPGSPRCDGGNLTGVNTAGGVRTYHYDEAQRTPISQPRALTGITTAGGVREATWSYDLNGMATAAGTTGKARPVAME